MELTSISVSGLHGFIRANLKLKKDIAIVVGVNGAGKTSLLNLTANVLRMNFNEMLATKFDTFILKGRVGTESFEISCAQTSEKFEIKLKRKNKLIETKVLPVPKWEETIYQERASKYAYDRLMRRIYDEIAGSKVAKFLRDNARLTLVRLDRTLFAEEGDGAIAIDAPHLGRRVREVDDPVSRVDQVTKDRYNKYRIEARKFHEVLTTQIVSLLFQLPTSMTSGRPSTVKFTPAQLEALRDKLIKVLNIGATQELSGKVVEYFNFAAKSLEDVSVPFDGTPEASRRYVTHFLFQSVEYPRLRGLSAAFERYEKDIAKSFAQLEVFKRQLNDFLSDSKKEMFFSEVESSLRFRLKGTKDTIGRPISELSSGEKQIVIMLTYLAFLAGSDSIFIVDEPELSLHLAWQRKLIESLSVLRPQSSQLILATHSPEIVGQYRSAVTKLSPDYTEA